jgi:hypothetical protein
MLLFSGFFGVFKPFTRNKRNMFNNLNPEIEELVTKTNLLRVKG